ncbi:MAG: M15 family metallopeptidase [Planctomycetales bacterium]|nr:M15 family metallopeptidase [Planctomycetales bacterium]
MTTISGSVGRNGQNQDADVRIVQELLNRHVPRLGVQPLVVDGDVGPLTLAAITAFQRQVVGFARPDGRVDPNGRTWRALTQAGTPGTPRLPPTPVATPAAQPEVDADWPPRPSFSALVGDAARANVFGRFQYTHDPLPDNPENIRVSGTWRRDNIVRTSIDMGPMVGTRTVYFHRLAVTQLESLWRAWGEAGLLDRVRTYAGSYVPRFIRGSTRTLSNHAYGSAFDINAAWNGLGRTPAAVGSIGCVRELVPLAHQYGFYWGGHFRSRPDGMHFEVAKIL